MSSKRIYTIAVALLALGIGASGGCNLVLGIHDLTADGAGGGGGSPCDAVGQCDDLNPCTADACTAGTCAHVDQPDGPAPSAAQVAFDCKVVMCAQGVEKDQEDNADILVDAEDCTFDTCGDGVPHHTGKPDGTPCTMGDDGTCIKGKCSIVCLTDDQCNDNNPCTQDSCDVGQGVCSFPPLNGVTPPDVTQMDGDCNVQICVEGTLLNSIDDSDPKKTATDCDEELCAGGVGTNPSLKIDVSCGANKDKYCDGAGACGACNSPTQCPGLENDCSMRTCVAHVCGITFAPAHTPRAAGLQNAADCHVVVCDGAGNSAMKDDVDDTDLPVDGNLCTKDVCTGGVISHPLEAPATPCGVNGACNAVGQCGCANNAACVAPNTCGGGNPGTAFFCGCTSETCGTLNKTCGSLSDGCFATLSCNTGTKNGSETDVDCGGIAGTCGTTCVNSKQCNIDSDCGSGHCADGVCCNTACTGTCQACTMAKKGAGADGVCSSIALGLQDPNATLTCIGTNACDGANNCKKLNGQTCTTSSQCVNGSCADGVCCNTACNGTCLACTAALKGTGADGVCGNIPVNQPDTAATATCTGTSSCDGNAACKKNVGQACTAGSQCVNGNCVDGVCCGSASCGTCQSCNLTTPGTCTDIANGNADNNPVGQCVGSNMCDGTGLCKKVNGQTCTGNVDCLMGNCIDGYCCNSTCAGTCKACNIAGSLGVCSNIVSGVDNNATLTCTAPSACDNGTCKKGNGPTCAVPADCLSGNCVDGVCCDTTCTGTCKACNVSGNAGTCSNVATGSTDPLTCTAPNACDNGACKKDDGATCVAPGDCIHNNCIDGVCCNTDCLGTCQSCNIAGSMGTCSDIPKGMTDANATTTCTGTSVCDGSGNGSSHCKLKNGQGCTVPTAGDCLDGNCADGVCCNTSCGLIAICMSCDQAGKVGTCSMVSNGDDSDSCLMSTSTCTAAGACLLKPGQGCTVGMAALCASGVCVPPALTCQ